jgi:hypothetical protein
MPTITDGSVKAGVDERLSLKVSDATLEMFLVSACEVQGVAFAGSKDFQ